MENFEKYLESPMEDMIIESVVPKSCKKEPVMMGIDEAGRGPVLGPMVYGIAYFPLSCSAAMKKMDFADSKTLTEEKREKIFENLDTDKCKDLGWMVKVLSPVTISNAMFRRSKYNLNTLSHDTAMLLVDEVLKKGVDIDELYVDTVGPKEKYQEMLKKRFPNIRKIVVESKADSKFHVVSAASICAKVIRDRVVTQWRFPEKLTANAEGTEAIDLVLGSGYPGDPNTKAYLRENLDPVFGFPTLVRFSWGTVKTILDNDKKAIECLWEEEDETENLDAEANGSMAITDFFKRKDTGDHSNGKSRAKKVKSHSFFTDRNLTRVSSLKHIVS